MEALCCTPILDGTITEDDATDLAGVLKALADPVRLRLVSIVDDQAQHCGQADYIAGLAGLPSNQA